MANKLVNIKDEVSAKFDDFRAFNIDMGEAIMHEVGGFDNMTEEQKELFGVNLWEVEYTRSTEVVGQSKEELKELSKIERKERVQQMALMVQNSTEEIDDISTKLEKPKYVDWA